MSTESILAVLPASAIGAQGSNGPVKGLTNEEAASRLKRDGPNSMPVLSVRPMLNLGEFWAPIPWLLEASLVREVEMHKYFGAAINASLLLFNATLAFVQAGRAQAALKGLQSRLVLSGSVFRDGKCKTILQLSSPRQVSEESLLLPSRWVERRSSVF